MNPPQLVDKPLSYRLWELSESLRVVRDALEDLRVGKLYQMRALASQLRVLLTDRSKGIVPLLLDIAAQLDNPMVLYHARGVLSAQEATAEGPDPTLFIMAGFPITVHREWDDQIKSDIHRVLKLNMLRYGGKAFSPKDIIEFFANNAGGAHSPSRWPRELAELMFSMQLSGAPAPVTILAQLGEAVLRIGASMLRKVGCVEVFCALVVPPQKVEQEVTLFQVDYDPLPASISLTLNPLKRLQFRVTSMHGLQLSVNVEAPVDWSVPHYLIFSQWITDDLFTESSAVLDGYRVGNSREDSVFMLPAIYAPYTIYVNRNKHTEFTSCKIGVLETYVSPRSDPSINNQRMLWLYGSLHNQGLQRVSCWRKGSMEYRLVETDCNSQRVQSFVR